MVSWWLISHQRIASALTGKDTLLSLRTNLAETRLFRRKNLEFSRSFVPNSLAVSCSAVCALGRQISRQDPKVPRHTPIIRDFLSAPAVSYVRDATCIYCFTIIRTEPGRSLS